ncbi:hypothetical protein VDGD_02900 [Verticillium dahliae]|uniref:Integral membrane protein n=1 Tax=Verticillium dahliae (strain VdLs.17 / ATCC MYA-4575 / FGSC 10137) TaxID=498257 RepID=G2WXC1_VERDV|nr:uncharacterized protein VDAG_02900 [Verticillium dahliae VdLs.17]KAH6707375.1 integral membrane protein [Verticillium dahliae]EGY21376.1 integral membrane protein [Verticillium dahliae VdLs.17]PNH56428.1 hypothetical protein VD0003_g1269 [Verticillium dahliae]PNH75690.1 hypothetical protein VD0001_g1864 [Verticillium dahliae]RBQ89335.1 hypothetical protein VDGD_02900 [Verticillium dahliae]
MVIAGFFAIACFNCIEILITLLNRFKRPKSLYFWSMLVTTLGTLLHTIVVLLRYYALGPNFTLAVLTCVGWYGMVTGFSVVLYSRIHLVEPDKTKTRWILVMIVTSFCVFHVPVTVLFLGSNTQHTATFIRAFDIYERVQLAGFCIQECLISGFYILESLRSLRPILAVKLPRERQIIRNLVIVNVFVMVLDISLLVTQYTGNFQIQTTYKPVVYSIKLKMEFIILNRLLCLVQHGNNNDWYNLESSSARYGQWHPSISDIRSFDPNAQSVGHSQHGMQLQLQRSSEPAAQSLGVEESSRSVDTTLPRDFRVPPRPPVAAMR